MDTGEFIQEETFKEWMWICHRMKAKRCLPLFLKNEVQKGSTLSKEYEGSYWWDACIVAFSQSLSEKEYLTNSKYGVRIILTLSARKMGSEWILWCIGYQNTDMFEDTSTWWDKVKHF